MKKILTLVFGLIAIALSAQTPAGFSYQAVVRNSGGQVLASQSVTIKVSLTNSEGTTTHYSETHATTTSAQGLAAFVVGNGQNKTGNFSSTPWSSQPIYISIELMLSGATTYTPMGRQQLQAVPYALYAADGVSIQWLGTLVIAPNTPAKNQAYYNSTDRKSYLWDGDSWEILTMDGQVGPKGDTGNPGPQGIQGIQGVQGPAGPQGPAGVGLTLKGNWSISETYVEGDYVFDESSTTAGVNSMWICQVEVGPSASQPKADLTHWVEFEAPAGPQGLPGLNGTSIQWLGSWSTVPGSATLNQAYYNTAEKKSFIWDGDSWELITKDGEPGPSGMSIPGTQGQMLVNSGTDWVATGKITVNADTLGVGIQTPISKMVVKGDATALPEDPIFEVKNKDGKVVFGVYNEGVRVYVADGTTKGAKGGFAVGGLSTQGKAGGVEYMRITPDSARIYIDTSSAKGAKGGFAVGGLSTQGKADMYELLRVTKDSTRIYVSGISTKGAKGGFAVGGLSTQGKTDSRYDLLRVTKDSTRIYVDEGAKGGFAVGGLSTQGKSAASQFLNITPDNYFIGHQAGDSINGGLYNSFMGYQSGISNTTGSNNVFLGYQSGYFNKTGNNNVIIGNETGRNSTIGSYNTFLGYKSGFSSNSSYNTFLGYETGVLTIADYNSFIGYQSGNMNTSGTSNVFLGYQAGFSNLTGSNNVIMGNLSGFEATDGHSNVFIGDSAGYGNSNSFNVFLGKGSGKANDGTYNTFIGYQTGSRNTVGASNVFMGYRSGFHNLDGSNNVFIGYESGLTNNQGHSNVFLGMQSGLENTLGFSNVFIGALSGSSNTEGYNNVFMGTQSGTANTFGYNNVFLGNLSGFVNSTGSNNVFLGTSSGAANDDGINNVYIGLSSGSSNTTGDNNVYLGKESGKIGTTGNNNTFIGYQTGYNNTADFNTFIGYMSGMMNSSGTFNTFMGYQTGLNYTSGNYNTFIGYQAGLASEVSKGTGSNNVGLGYMVGSAITSGSSNVFLGNSSGQNNTNGNYNTLLGNEAGKGNTIGDFNVFIGHQSGFNDTASYNTFVGYKSGYTNKTGKWNVLMGFEAGYSNDANYNSFIGYQAGKNYTAGNYNTFFGYQAGFASEASKGTGKNNVALGYKAGFNLTYGENNIFIGTEAGASTTGVSLDTVRGENTFIGYWAGKNNTTGYQNIAIGYQAGLRLSSNNRNTLVGSSAGQELTDGSANTFYGTYAGRLTTSGKNNTLVGYDCGYQVYTGSHNTFIGFQAGRGWGATAIGDSSVFIGSEAGANEAGSNKLYIANTITSTPLIWGDFKLGYAAVHGKFGVGTKTPGYSIEANGTNASIIAHYGSNTRGGISAFPLYRLAFLTTDVSNDLVFGYSPDPDQADFSTAFVERMRVDNSTGRVGIGTQAPTERLHVKGSTSIDATLYLEPSKWTSIGDYAQVVFGDGNHYIRGEFANGLTFYTISADGFQFMGGGRVGIGRKSTANMLEVQGAASKDVAGDWLANSDKRIKTDISDIDDAFSIILKLRPVKFKYTDSWIKKHPSIENKYYYNFIAQEFQQVFPESVKGSGEYLEGDSQEILQIDSYNAQIVSIKAIQELILENQQQKAEIELLKKKVDEINNLKTELEAIKALLKK